MARALRYAARRSRRADAMSPNTAASTAGIPWLHGGDERRLAGSTGRDIFFSRPRAHPSGAAEDLAEEARLLEHLADLDLTLPVRAERVGVALDPLDGLVHR